MEVARSNAASSGRTCSGPSKRHVIKPRSHSDMEEELRDRSRKTELPVGSRTPTMSRFGIRKSQKGSSSSVASAASSPSGLQFKSQSRNNGSVVNMPLPPTPPSAAPAATSPIQLMKSPTKLVQPKRKSSDGQGQGQLPSPLPPHQNQRHRLPLHRPNQSSVTGSLPAAFGTNFSRLIGLAPPAIPDGFLRPTNTFGKVKVILKITPHDAGQRSCLSVDPFKRHVTLVDLLSSGGALPGSVSALQRPPHAPKMFFYDGVVGGEAEPQSASCAAALPEAVHAVVGGLDGCVMSYGHARLGKTHSMIGSDASAHSLGLVPTAISWLFRLIGDRRRQAGIRYTVRASAVEVAGRHEEIRDLLSGDGVGHVILKDDPISGAQLGNLSELKAPTAEQACHYLDLALSAKPSVGDSRESRRNSHFIFILNVYQTSSDDPQNNVIHSRLYLIDFGSCGRAREGSTTLSLSALGMLILALLNGQRHIPYRESRLAQILKSAIGSSGCHSTVLVHVTGNPHLYNETLQMLQLTSRMNKLKIRKRSKAASSASSDDAGASRSHKHRKGVRMGTLREAGLFYYSSGCEGGLYSSGSGDVSTDAASAVLATGYDGDARRSFGARSGPPSAAGSCVTLDPVLESCCESLGSGSGNGHSHRHRHHHHQQQQQQLQQLQHLQQLQRLHRFGGSSGGVAKLPLHLLDPYDDDDDGHLKQHHHRYYHHHSHQQHHHPRFHGSAPSSTVSAPAYSQRRPRPSELAGGAEEQEEEEEEEREEEQEGQGGGGVNSRFQRLQRRAHREAPPFSPSRELWIDGPNADYAGSRPSPERVGSRFEARQGRPGERFEQWVDGPPEFRQTLTRASVSVRKIGHSKIVKVASLRCSADGSGTYGESGEEGRDLRGMTPLFQSTPNSTLTRATSWWRRGKPPTASEALEALGDPAEEIPAVVNASSGGHSGGRHGQARVQGDGVEDPETPVEMDGRHSTLAGKLPSGRKPFVSRSSPIGDLSGRDPRSWIAEDDLDLSTICRDQDDAAGKAEANVINLVPALLMTNRESVYELQMDKDLEFASGTESLRRLACSSDDDEPASLWTVSMETSACGRAKASGPNPRCPGGNDSTSFDPLPASTTTSDLATVWMERDFTVESFYLPVGTRPNRDRDRDWARNRNRNCSQGLPGGGEPRRSAEECFRRFPCSAGGDPSSSSRNASGIDCKPETNPDASTSGRGQSSAGGPARNGESAAGREDESRPLSTEAESNPGEMVQSIHSQVSGGTPRRAKISKVPKLGSFSPEKGARPSRIPLSPSSSSKISNSASFSSIATTSGTASDSGPVESPDRPRCVTRAPQAPAPSPAPAQSQGRSKVEAAPGRASQSFLQRLRTPLFFRCKGSDKGPEPAQQRVKAGPSPPPSKEVKVGRLVSKVKLFKKDERAAAAPADPKARRSQRPRSPAGGLKPKPKPVGVSKSPGPPTYETRLTPVEQPLRPLCGNRPGLDRFDPSSGSSPGYDSGSVPAPARGVENLSSPSVPSPVIDHSYHSSVMQLMSPDGTAPGGGSVFDEGALPSEESTDGARSKVQRSQSEPNGGNDPSSRSSSPSSSPSSPAFSSHAVPRHSKSFDLLNGVGARRRRARDAETRERDKTETAARPEAGNGRTKARMCSLNDTLEGRTTATNCFEVTCLAKGE